MARDSGVKQRRAVPDHGAALWSQYGQELHRYLMKRLRNSQDARDLAQEVYLRMLRIVNRGALQDFRAYMYRIAAHVVYEYRHRGREPHVDFDSEVLQRWSGEADLSHEPCAQLCSEQQLQRQFEQLDPHSRAIFALYMGERLCCEQIAERLELSTHTVRKYLTRAIAELSGERRRGGMERRRP